MHHHEPPPNAPPRLLPDVSHIVAVSSGKGGVGKSTVAVNVAVALARMGLKVGVLDADIYGPNIPIMFGIREQPVMAGGKIEPHERYGVKLMSLGFLIQQEEAVIWRGPMVMHALITAMAEVGEPNWTPELHNEWVIAIWQVAKLMMDAEKGGALAP